MEQQQLEILGRFDDSRNAYNTASGLLKKGAPDEAEKLLRKALALYPREVMMDESVSVDPTVRESFDLLFSNIRMRLEQIEREKHLPPPITSGAVSSLQEIVERNMGLKSGLRPAPAVYGGDSTAAASSSSHYSSTPAAQPAPVTIPTIEEVLSMGDEPEVTAVIDAQSEPLDSIGDEPAQAAEEKVDDAPRAPKYAYEPPEEDPSALAAELAEPAAETSPAEASDSGAVAAQEEMIPDAAPYEAPAPAEKVETAPVAVDETPAAASEEVLPAPEPEPEQDITDGVFGGDKKKRKGFSMKLPGFLKRKEKPVKDDKVVDGDAPEKALDESATEPAAAESAAESAEQSTESAADGPDVQPAAEVIRNDADEAAPPAAEVKGAKPGKKAGKPKKEKPARTRAEKAPAKKKPARKAKPKKPVDVTGLAASLIFAVLVGAGAAAAFIGVKPLMRLQRAFVYSMNVEHSKAGKPPLADKIMDGALGISGGGDALSGLSALAEASAPDEQGRGLLVAAASSDVSKLTALKKSDEAMRIAVWAESAGLKNPLLADKKFQTLFYAVVEKVKSGDPEGGNKYFDQLSEVMKDENFPDPGSHYLRAVKTAKVANFLFLALADKRLDRGDAEGAYWALDRIRASRADIAEKFGPLAAKTSGSLAALAARTRGSDPENAARWDRMSRSVEN